MLRNAVLTPANDPFREPVPRGSYSSLHFDFIRRRFRVGGRLVKYDKAISLSAPSPKLVWNAQGQLVQIPAGQPAWDHDPVTGEPLGQLIESVEATNQVQWSEDLTNWVNPVGVTVETDHAGGPELISGRIMDRIVISDQNESHRLLILTGGYDSLARFRVYVKPDGIKVIGFGRAAIDGADLVVFDIENGTVLVENGADYKNGTIEVLPSGLRVLEFDNAISPSSARSPNLHLLDPNGSDWAGDNSSWQGDGTSGVYVGGASLFDTSVQGEKVTESHVPTYGNAVTRAADVADADSAFVERYDPTSGWLFIEYDHHSSASAPGFILSLKDSSTGVQADRLAVLSTLILVRGIDSTVIYNSPAVDLKGHHKVLLRWDGQVLTIFVDGGILDSADINLPVSLNELFFFTQRNYSSAASNGHLFEFRMGDTISDADAIARTTL